MTQGDQVIAYALSHARRSSVNAALGKYPLMDFTHGLCLGQLIVARVYLKADPLSAQGAENEINWLFDGRR